MLRRHITSRILRSIILGVTAGGLFACLVLLPLAIEAGRDAAHRLQVAKNLKKISLTLTQYRMQTSEPAAPRDSRATKLAFDTYSGYFVSNQFEPNVAQSFVVITNRDEFDKVFGIARVMNDKSHRLPANAFQSHIVLAVIKRANAVWQFNVNEVVVRDGMATLKYTATATKSDSASFACPLIVSIPKDNYRAVRFVENGKLQKKVGLSTK
jgi:hypothetical protein